MEIKAKYRGKCRKCGGEISVGDVIQWIKGNGAYHAACFDTSSDRPRVETTRSNGFPSKYAGTCTKCGGEIKMGDMIHYSKETKATHVECPSIEFELPELPDPDESVINASWYDGEYCSGYMVNACNKSLEKLGVLKYLRGWGDKLENFVVEKLGKEFTIGQVKELVIPILKARFEKENEARINKVKDRLAKFEEARATGKPVVLDQWSEQCNDPREECDIDNVTIYAMPDGSTQKTRSHTW